MKTPEQIARETCEASNWIQPDDRHEFMDAMVAAIEADRAQRRDRGGWIVSDGPGVPEDGEQE